MSLNGLPCKTTIPARSRAAGLFVLDSKLTPSYSERTKAARTGSTDSSASSVSDASH